jgi:hypothetical protein
MALQGSLVYHIEALDVSFLMMYNTWGAAGILKLVIVRSIDIFLVVLLSLTD